MNGRRLPDTEIGGGHPDDREPGDYWFVTVRTDHPEYPRRLNVKDHPEDRRWWGTGNDHRFDQNLTGWVLGCITPDGRFAMLSIHTVREHDDSTISVRPGDGSSNSILVSGGSTPGQWHGYIEHGEWTPC